MKGSNAWRRLGRRGALLALLFAARLDAQEAQEGVGGTIDKKRRSPIIFVDPKAEGRTVRILVDAFVPNEEYREYPIKVEFYVNRQLFATQIRSKELPGPLGVAIGADVAVKPFNYSIVATLLHPNRQFVSVAQGAIVDAPPTAAPSPSPGGTPVSGSLRCTLTTRASLTDSPSGDSPVEDTYEAEGVVPSTSGSGEVSLSFTATAEGQEDQAVRATLKPGSGDEVTGSLSFNDVGGDATAVTGSMTRTESGSVGTIDVENSSGDALECNADD